ncbi:MAG: hypothetical protein M3220_14140 [Chloroflexota bacterium]|nr:hypothetical protein [Chloroflexota bacterium]
MQARTTHPILSWVAPLLLTLTTVITPLLIDAQPRPLVDPLRCTTPSQTKLAAVMGVDGNNHFDMTGEPDMADPACVVVPHWYQYSPVWYQHS